MINYHSIGRLSQDPEIRTTSNGEAVYNFNFAVDRRFQREGGKKADFFRCVAFGKTAERMQKCAIKKGTKLYVEGWLELDDYTDKNGIERQSVKITISDFTFCESKNATPQAATPAPKPQRATEMTAQEFATLDPGIDAELPFY